MAGIVGLSVALELLKENHYAYHYHKLYNYMEKQFATELFNLPKINFAAQKLHQPALEGHHIAYSLLL